MMSTEKKNAMTRREFLRDASVVTLGGSLLLTSSSLGLAEGDKSTEQPTSKSKSDVVLVRNTEVLDAEGNPREEIVLEMLDAAVSRLTTEKDATEGWRTLIKPDDVVGIKTNVWTPIGTTAAVEQALKKRVMGAGVAESEIGISDRGVLRDPVFERTTALINARPMRTHHWSGVGSLIKNYIMFVSDPYNYHEEACSRLGEIWTYPIVKDKTRLNVLVMFTPQFHNVGPHGFSPRHVHQYHGLLVGFDPVAIDSLGVRIIQGMRDEYFGEERPLSPSARHIEVADTEYHLGTSNMERINLTKIGYDEKSYI
jgi:hypothetical protein